MRQIVLLNESNLPSGILTRKDLMGFAVEEKLQASVSRRDSDQDQLDKEDGLTPNGNSNTSTEKTPVQVASTVHTISNDQAEGTRWALSDVKCWLKSKFYSRQ